MPPTRAGPAATAAPGPVRAMTTVPAPAAAYRSKTPAARWQAPRPPPSELAVEKPSAMAAATSGMPGPWSVAASWTQAAGPGSVAVATSRPSRAWRARLVASSVAISAHAARSAVLRPAWVTAESAMATAACT